MAVFMFKCLQFTCSPLLSYVIYVGLVKTLFVSLVPSIRYTLCLWIVSLTPNLLYMNTGK